MGSARIKEDAAFVTAESPWFQGPASIRQQIFVLKRMTIWNAQQLTLTCKNLERLEDVENRVVGDIMSGEYDNESTIRIERK